MGSKLYLGVKQNKIGIEVQFLYNLVTTQKNIGRIEPYACF